MIVFTDGGYIDLRPLAWVMNTWTHEDGNSTDWDVMGGPCGFRYETTYSMATACFAGQLVTAVYVVADNFLYPTGYTTWIDNLQYYGKTISNPSDNSNS
ncbi:MAG TPA: hypothetical protein VFB34_01070 [Chloroflexota bacterium]|nr:hypothetical protein [Chloroflexota bacterium]